MFEIPITFKEDDYIQLPQLRTFCAEHCLQLNENKKDLLDRVEKFANENAENLVLTKKWINDVVREGTKEILYRKVYIGEQWKDYRQASENLENYFPSCTQSDILDYCNTSKCSIVNYSFEKDQKTGAVKKILFTFSQKLLEKRQKEKKEEALTVIYPIFIDLYVDEGFVVARYCSKTNVFNWTSDFTINVESKFNTRKRAIEVTEKLLNKLNIDSVSVEKSRANVQGYLYKLYEKYSFTPNEIKKVINSQKERIRTFVINYFKDMGIGITSVPEAIKDMEIFFEKYLATNSDFDDNVFKKDREAYIIRIRTDNIQEMTRIDAQVKIGEPLQCTEAFYDSKKTMIKNKECDRLNLCYNRNYNREEKRKYFSSHFLVKYDFYKGYGIVNIKYCAERRDIENVLQAIFEND